MNWHYGDPIRDGKYLCGVRGYSSPIDLVWYKEKGGWVRWVPCSSNWSGIEWNPFDDSIVVCYIGFDEISMPEGW